MTGRRVVVTGIGTINPLGNSIEEYFSNLEKGVSGLLPQQLVHQERIVCSACGPVFGGQHDLAAKETVGLIVQGGQRTVAKAEEPDIELALVTLDALAQMCIRDSIRSFRIFRLDCPRMVASRVVLYCLTNR